MAIDDKCELRSFNAWEAMVWHHTNAAPKGLQMATFRASGRPVPIDGTVGAGVVALCALRLTSITPKLSPSALLTRLLVTCKVSIR